jgi:AraC family transcriptional regulator, carnitine catabolism transcriptional activator
VLNLGTVHQLALLLLPEFSNLGLAAATEPLFVANWLAQSRLFAWHAVSVDGKPVRASSGIAVPVEGDLEAAQGCGTVFVLASFEPATVARNRLVFRWLKRMARAGVELGGLENGSLALAEAGVLEDHAAAVHWDNLAGFQELFPRIRITRHAYSFSRNRITCVGGAAILEMMIAWIGRRTDEQTAQEVARHLLVYPHRGALRESGATQSRRAQPRDGAVARAQAIMQAAIDDPLACEAIARRLNISLRQLERRFKQQLGRTMHGAYRSIRIEKAHQYLQQTGLSVTEVAALTGFSSVEYFSKVYRGAFGVLPSRDRTQSTDAPVFRAGSKIIQRGRP